MDMWEQVISLAIARVLGRRWILFGIRQPEVDCLEMTDRRIFAFIEGCRSARQEKTGTFII